MLNAISGSAPTIAMQNTHGTGADLTNTDRLTQTLVHNQSPGGETRTERQLTEPMDALSQSTAETWLSIASLAETLKDADRAAMAYDATLQHNPSSTKALTSLAHLYRSRDMFQRAAELYQRALAITPDLGDIWATLGHCYLMLDELQSAYAAYQQALYHLSNPNIPKLWHGIGILYDRYGSLDYAEEAFAKVLELDPQFEKANEIYFRLGIIYKHQGKWNQALDCFRYILPQPPAPLQEWDVWFQLGSVLESMGEWQGARDAYEHILSQNDRHAKVLQQLGCLYGMNTVSFYDPQRGMNLLLKSLEIDSSDATTWYHLGRIHMICNDYTSAYDAFQQAVNRDSRNPTFWCSIGVLYYQIAQYRDALDAYTRAIRLNPYISEVWYDLGTLYETCNNQLNDALDAYKQAARLDPNNVHIKERLEVLTAQLAAQHQTGDHHNNAGTTQSGTSLPLTTQLPQLLPQASIHSQIQQPAQTQTQTQTQTQHQHQQHLQHQPQLPHHINVPQPQPQQQHTPSMDNAEKHGRPIRNEQQQPFAIDAEVPQTSQQQHQVIPQKRPLEGGMDTLFSAISQQEGKQYNHHNQLAGTGNNTFNTNNGVNAPSDEANRDTKSIMHKNRIVKPETIDSSSSQTTVLSTNNQKSMNTTQTENIVTSLNLTPKTPAIEDNRNVTQKRNSTNMSVNEHVTGTAEDQPTIQPAIQPTIEISREKHVPIDTRTQSPTSSADKIATKIDISTDVPSDPQLSDKIRRHSILQDSAVKIHRSEVTEETVIKPSADAIETLKEQERLRKEEETESMEKIEEIPSEPKEKVVRQVEEDENYDE